MIPCVVSVQVQVQLPVSELELTVVEVRPPVAAAVTSEVVAEASEASSSAAAAAVLEQPHEVEEADVEHPGVVDKLQVAPAPQPQPAAKQSNMSSFPARKRCKLNFILGGVHI